MAEGWTLALHGESIVPLSAGVEPTALDPRAVRVMAEAGVDIGGHRSKHVDQILGEPLDLVVTGCAGAGERCPVFPGSTRVIHVGFDDPPALAATASSEEGALDHYRRVRDEIRRFVENLPEQLPS